MAELARRLEVSGQHIGDVISGKRRAGKSILDKIGVSIERSYRVTAEAINDD